MVKQKRNTLMNHAEPIDGRARGRSWQIIMAPQGGCRSFPSQPFGVKECVSPCAALSAQPTLCREFAQIDSSQYLSLLERNLRRKVLASGKKLPPFVYCAALLTFLPLRSRKGARLIDLSTARKTRCPFAKLKSDDDENK